MLTFQVDSFEESVQELQQIFVRHHKELALFQDCMPLAPDIPEYIRRERDGSLFMTTGRRDGAIVAYYVAQCRPGFHYVTTFTGTMDICYVVPEQRNVGLARPLFKITEKELQRRGVKIWYSGFKKHNPLGMPELLDLLGFIPADEYRVKWIGGVP